MPHNPGAFFPDGPVFNADRKEPEPMKRQIPLSGEWTLRALGETETIPARVPGSVYTDLLAAGKMEDPFFRDNELKAFDLMEKDYVFERTFALDETALSLPSMDLVAEGLDTLADVSLNGRLILRADNMHRTWRTDVRPYVRAGENTLGIVFHSPNRAARQAHERDGLGGSGDAVQGFPGLRKAHCMFGWDWGPRLPDAGIFRDIYLEITDGARLESVLVRQAHEKDRVTLSFTPQIEALPGAGPHRVRYTVLGPDGEKLGQTEEPRFVILSPRLWWPLGAGEQPLYTLITELMDGAGRLLDEKTMRLGLRDIRVQRPKQQEHEGFYIEVNGQGIFMMGADYIPQDCLLPRVTEEKMQRLLADCALAHMNCLRVWGGGYYLPDRFYDMCDEMGILIWQDFMFACAYYSLDHGMEDSLRAEFRDNVQRLRHHACIALWCGNNEVETAVAGRWYQVTPAVLADYQRLFMGILPEMLRELDPDRFYWPSSPSSGGDLMTPSGELAGDVHDWDVWHGGKPFQDYRNHDFGFVSEFGFQSFPALRTIESFTLPGDRNIFSYVMEKHQRNNAANGKILQYLSSLYLYPGDLSTLVYASQLMQLEAIRCGVEHWRSRRGVCMGAIYWQLNDNWPVASWASIDYYGRWKALHYGARRFFAPLLLVCEEEGEHTQRANVNAEASLSSVRPSARLSVVNDTPEESRVQVRWAVVRSDGQRTALSGDAALTVPAFTAQPVQTLDLPQVDFRNECLWYELIRDGQTVSASSALFCPPKYFRFEDPHLSVRQDGDRLTVRAQAFARMVELTPLDGDAVLSDNYFDMLPGERTVKIIRGSASSWQVRSVYDIR